MTFTILQHPKVKALRSNGTPAERDLRVPSRRNERHPKGLCESAAPVLWLTAVFN